MKRKIFLTLCFIMIVASTVYGGDNRVGLTLIPPGTITNKVDLDIRAGIVNQGTEQQDFKISIYLNNVEQQSLLHYSTLRIIRLFPTLSVVFNTYLILCDAPMGSVIVE